MRTALKIPKLRNKARFAASRTRPQPPPSLRLRSQSQAQYLSEPPCLRVLRVKNRPPPVAALRPQSQVPVCAKIATVDNCLECADRPAYATSHLIGPIELRRR